MKLRSRLVSVVLVTLLPMLLVSIVALQTLLEREQRTHELALVHVSRAIGGAVETEFARTISALQVLARSDALARGDLRALEPALRDTWIANQRWTNLLLIDARGEVRLDMRDGQGTPQPVIRDMQVLNDALAADEPTVAPVRAGSATGRPFIAVLVPSPQPGGARYLLSAAYDYDFWTGFLAPRTPEGWVSAVDDREGTIAARSADAERFVGKRASDATRVRYERDREGIVDTVNLDDEAVKVAFTTLPAWAGGMRVLVVVPAAIFQAPLATTRRAMTLGVLGAALVAVCAFWLALRATTRALESLPAAIRAASGGRSLAVPMSGTREIDAALNAAREASDAIAQRTAEVGRLQQSLTERARAAEAANLAKSRLIAAVSHELRNPLGAISNALAALTHLVAEPAGERMLAIARRQTDVLAGLVDGLLDAARLDGAQTPLATEPLDLAALATDELRRLREAGALDRHCVEANVGSVQVLGEAAQLRQVLAILVENAVKFTPPGGSIRVDVTRDADAAYIVVADSGRGIRAEDLPRLFVAFEQAGSEPHALTGGLGLGLAIAKRIVERHGGTISVQSRGAGEGARFAVSLPLPRAPTPPVATATP